MTAPTTDQNNINLAALWIPVMPETSHMTAGAREAGVRYRQDFISGLNSGGPLGGIGESLGSQLSQGFTRGIGRLELPLGLGNVAEGLMRGFEGLQSRAESLEAANNKLATAHDRLTDAQSREAVAALRLNDLRQRGVTSGSQYLSAATSYEAASRRTAAASQDEAEAHSAVEQASRAASGGIMSFAMETGLLAGAVGGAIPLVGELASGMVEFAGEAVSKAVEGTIELGKRLVEIGEDYEQLGIQVREYSNASGEAFDALEASAQRVFGQLDVAGKNTGQTMAELSSRLDTQASPALETLTKHIEDLQGRYTDLSTEKVATDFSALGVNIGNADNVLASWLNSSREAGLSLGALTNTMSQFADALRPEVSGLSAEQLGKWTAEIESKIPGANRMVMALTGSMKEFSDKGLTFQQGMAELAKELSDPAFTEAQKEDLAEKFFGTRQWSQAMDAVNMYLGVVRQGPDAVAANGAAIDDFNKKTEDLGNKWQEVQHKIEQAVLPLGQFLLGSIGSGLDQVIDYLDTNQTKIAAWVKNVGDTFIGMLPGIKEFAEDFLNILEPVAVGIQAWAGGIMVAIGTAMDNIATVMGTLEGPLGHLIPGFDKLKDSLKSSGDSAIQMGKGLMDADIAGTMDKIKGKIDDLNINVPELKSNFDDLANTMTGRLAIGAAQSAQALTMNVPGAPGGSGATGATGGVSGGGGGPTDSSPDGVKALAQQMFPNYFPQSEWQAFDTLEMHEAGYNPTAQNPKSTAYGIGQFLDTTWAPYGAKTSDPKTQLDYMFRYIKDRYGTPSAAWAQSYNHPGGEGSYQHGGSIPLGDTGDINVYGDLPWDFIGSGQSPALRLGKGDIGSSAGDPRGGAWTPSPKAGAGKGAKVGVPYWGLQVAAQGGLPPWLFGQDQPPTLTPKALGSMVTAGSGLHDDVPIMAKKGEYVWNTAATDQYGWLIDHLNSRARGMQGGGSVGQESPYTGNTGVLQVIWDNTQSGQKIGEEAGNIVGPGTDQPQYYNADWSGHTGHVHTSFATSPAGQFYGLPVGSDIRQGAPGFPDWVYQLGSQFGLDASTYPGHQEQSGYNRGIDWWPHGHADMSGQSYSNDERARLTSFATSVASLGRGAGGSPAAWGAGVTTGGAGQPVAWSQSGPAGTPGATPLSSGAGSSTFAAAPGGPPGPSGGGGGYMPMGGSRMPMPGMPYQYGGLGAYGGETMDQWVAQNKAINDAIAAQNSYNTEIAKLRDSLQKANDALGKAQAQPGLLSDPAKIQSLIQQRDEIQSQLNDKLGQQGQIEDNITDAKRKAWEDYYRSPAGAPQEYKIPGVSEFTQLGGGLLKGIGEELGFGDLFGKPPWEWGIVKLLGGLAGWGLGTANAWADEIGKGHTGLTGMQPLPGFEAQKGSAGLTGLLGNIVPGIKDFMPQPQMVNQFGQPITTRFPGPVDYGPGVSGGPNIVPSAGYGQPAGPAPGPALIQPNVTVNAAQSPNAVAAAVNDHMGSAQYTYSSPMATPGRTP